MVRDFHGKLPNVPLITTGLDIRLPIVGGVILHLDAAKAVPVEHEGPIAQRASNVDCGFDIATHLDEIVGIDAFIALTGIDREHAIAFGCEVTAQEAHRRFDEVAAAAVDADDQRRRARSLAFRLPQRGIDPRAIDRLDREKAQRGAARGREFGRHARGPLDHDIFNACRDFGPQAGGTNDSGHNRQHRP
jgi:hypothetical protein